MESEILLQFEPSHNSSVYNFEAFIHENLKKNDEKYKEEHFMPDGLVVLGKTGSGKSKKYKFSYEQPPKSGS